MFERAAARFSFAIAYAPPDDTGLYSCSTGVGGITANIFEKLFEKCRSSLRGGSNDPAATASATQAAIIATPPIGRDRPQPAQAGDGQDVKTSRKDQRAHQEEPAGGLKRAPPRP